VQHPISTTAGKLERDEISSIRNGTAQVRVPSVIARACAGRVGDESVAIKDAIG
jgi:hypothetical protein